MIEAIKMDWKEAESHVQKHFEDEGYVVLNQNDIGFPDLIAFKDGKIAFFVQVKARQNPFIFYFEGQCAESLKKKLDVEVKYINVKDGKLEPYFK
jgi:Holliday junction resolvase-like predicted endonuclease